MTEVKKMLEPYFRTQRGVLYNGDCIEVMKQLPKDSVDLVVTSPPYADVKKGVIGVEGNIDKTYKHVDRDVYVDWFVEVGKCIRDVLKPSGSFVLNIDTFYNDDSTRNLYVYELVIALVKRANLEFLQDCFWVKKSPIPSGYATQYIRFRSAVEYLFWFAKDHTQTKTRLKNVCLEPTEACVRSMKRKAEEFGDKRVYQPSGHSSNYKQAYETMMEHGSTPLNYIFCATAASDRLKYLEYATMQGIVHPARFPSDLPEYFILALTDPDDVVMDPFFGSGTVADVATQTGRRWIGIELSNQYCRIYKEYAIKYGIGFVPTLDKFVDDAKEEEGERA